MMKSHSKSITVDPHWSWHVLVAVAVMLLGMAAILHLQPVNKQPLAQAQQHLLVTACSILGIGCLVLWSLRRILSRDWRAALTRRTISPAPLARDIIPAVLPHPLEPGLWFTLALWTIWVVWTLTVDDRLAASLTLENGLLQDLTVLCYAAAAMLLFGLVLRGLGRENWAGTWTLVASHAHTWMLGGGGGRNQLGSECISIRNTRVPGPHEHSAGSQPP